MTNNNKKVEYISTKHFFNPAVQRILIRKKQERILEMIVNPVYFPDAGIHKSDVKLTLSTGEVLNLPIEIEVYFEILNMINEGITIDFTKYTSYLTYFQLSCFWEGHLESTKKNCNNTMQ